MVFRYGNLCGAIRRVQLCLSSPEYRVLAVEIARWKEVGFIIEPHHLNKIWHWFNLAFEPLTHLNTFYHVILCESLLDLDSVWIQLKVILLCFFLHNLLVTSFNYLGHVLSTTITLTVFLLKIFFNLLQRGKWFSIKFRNVFTTLKDISKLNGELNQMVLNFHFCLALFCSRLGGCIR